MWGAYGSGQCNVPPNLGSVVAVAAGGTHTAVIETHGTVVCWGDDTYTQCDVPVWLGPVVAVSAGTRHTLALRADGTVACWGAISLTGATNRVTAISAGLDYNVITDETGNVLCWGANPYHQCDAPSGLGVVLGASAGGEHVVSLAEYPTPSCPGDIHQNKNVNGEDLGELLATWGRCDGCTADINGDGNVNGADLGILLANWGTCPN